MKNSIKTTIVLLGLLLFTEAVMAQAKGKVIPKKLQSPMAKMNAQQNRMQQQVAAQRQQLKYAPTNAASVPPEQNRVSNSSPALPDKQTVVRPREN